MSIRMAPIVKIRNNIYFIAVGCFKALYEIDFMLDTCDLLQRLIEDLQKDNINDYLFQHLILMIQALHKQPSVLVQLVDRYSANFFKLFNSVLKMDKKITLIKAFIQIALRVPNIICEKNAEVFGNLFMLAQNVECLKEQDRVDIEESILWLQSTLLELRNSDEQMDRAITMCLKLKTADHFV